MMGSAFRRDERRRHYGRNSNSSAAGLARRDGSGQPFRIVSDRIDRQVRRAYFAVDGTPEEGERG